MVLEAEDGGDHVEQQPCSHHHQQEAQVEGDLADPQRRHDATQRHDRRVGGRVAALQGDEQRTAGLPAAREHLDPVDDETHPQQRDEEQQDDVEDLTEGLHGTIMGQLWLKNPSSAIRSLSSAEIATLGGESRKTLLVTRSMEPRVAKIRPAAKSTRRLASLSSISLRFMITGVPSR